MQNKITLRNKTPLPPVTIQRLQEWRKSPRLSYDSLPDVISHAEIFKSESPTLAQIKNRIGLAQAVMVVSLAINEVNMMFRANRRMTAEEVALTAKRIVNTYWYLKPEDIKKCFNSPRPKQFVLEGDSFLSWVAEYDLRRDNACEDDAHNGKALANTEGAVTYEEYKKNLPSDKRERIEAMEKAFVCRTEDEKHRKRNEEFAFMTKYRENIKKGVKQTWQK